MSKKRSSRREQLNDCSRHARSAQYGLVVGRRGDGGERLKRFGEDARIGGIESDDADETRNESIVDENVSHFVELTQIGDDPAGVHGEMSAFSVFVGDSGGGVRDDGVD